jgi:serine/threonine-protein kinase
MILSGPVTNGLLARDTVLNGTYRIDHWIGGGAMGNVYCGINGRLPRRPLAIKVLVSAASHAIPNAVERFRQEAAILSELDHPNIVQIFDFFDSDMSSIGVPYLVMQYVAGENLWRKTCQGQPLPLREVLPIAEQLSAALVAVHEKDIIHRDLKPQNVVLERRPGGKRETVKLLDFGIAKLRAAVTDLTRAGTALGTPRYLSPELAAGEGDIDARSDQFSLAAIIYGLITGRPAFWGDDDSVVLSNIRSRDPAPLDPTLHATEKVLLRALAKDRGSRFRDVDEFYRDLEFAARVDQSDLPALEPTKAIDPPTPTEIIELIANQEGGPDQDAPSVVGTARRPPFPATPVAPSPSTLPEAPSTEKPNARVPLVVPASPDASAPLAASHPRLAPTAQARINLTERKQASGRPNSRTTGKLAAIGERRPPGLIQPESSRKWLLWLIGGLGGGIAVLLAFSLSGTPRSRSAPPSASATPDKPALGTEQPPLAVPNNYPPVPQKDGVETQFAVPAPSGVPLLQGAPTADYVSDGAKEAPSGPPRGGRGPGKPASNHGKRVTKDGPKSFRELIERRFGQ